MTRPLGRVVEFARNGDHVDERAAPPHGDLDGFSDGVPTSSLCRLVAVGIGNPSGSRTTSSTRSLDFAAELRHDLRHLKAGAAGQLGASG